MQVNELAASFKGTPTKPFVLLSGDSDYQKTEVRRLLKAVQPKMQVIDAEEQSIDVIGNSPFFGNKYFYVTNIDRYKNHKHLISIIEQPAKNVYVVFSTVKEGGNQELLKRLKARLDNIILNQPKKKDWESWWRGKAKERGISLNLQSIEALNDILEEDEWTRVTALDTLRASGIVDPKHEQIQELLEDAISEESWKLQNAIVGKNWAATRRILSDQESETEAAYHIGSTAVKIWLINLMMDTLPKGRDVKPDDKKKVLKEIQEKLTPFIKSYQWKTYNRVGNNFSGSAVRRLLEKVVDIDKRFKSGKAPEWKSEISMAIAMMISPTSFGRLAQE